MNNIEANEAYRRSNVRDLVEQVMNSTDFPEDYDQDAIVDALLEADPYEREFDSVNSSAFWEIARRYSKDILSGDTVQLRGGGVRWIVQATYTDGYQLESPGGQKRLIRRNRRDDLKLIRRHGRPDLMS